MADTNGKCSFKIPEKTMVAIKELAKRDLRSTTAQIQFLLKYYLEKENIKL